MNANKMVELSNSFHGTSVRVRTSASTQAEAWFEIQAAVYGEVHPTRAAKARLRRVENELCGIDGCTCGTVR